MGKVRGGENKAAHIGQGKGIMFIFPYPIFFPFEGSVDEDAHEVGKEASWDLFAPFPKWPKLGLAHGMWTQSQHSPADNH